MVYVSEVRSRRAGGALSELMRIGKCGSHHRSLGNYWAWRVGKIKVFWSLNQLRARVGGRWHGKEERARAASSVRSKTKLHSLPPLPAENGHDIIKLD